MINSMAQALNGHDVEVSTNTLGELSSVFGFRFLIFLLVSLAEQGFKQIDCLPGLK